MSFTLRSLLLAFAVIASAMGAFGTVGLLLGFAVVGCVAYCRTRPITPAGCLVMIWGALILCAILLLPAVHAAKTAARRVQCMNHMKQISFALHTYHDSFGTFPPARVLGPDGEPWHSWRVLILPFLDQQALYAKYNFDEPWDGPNNSKLTAAMPSMYACPMGKSRTTGCTSYFAVVGSETAWPGAEPRRLDEISDDPGETILVMEAAGLGVPWHKPQDLQFDAVARLTEPDPKVIGAPAHDYQGGRFHTVEGGTINLAMADGHMENLPWGLPDNVLLPLLTANGGEKVDVDAIEPLDRTRPNWPRVLALAALVVSTGLLWWSTGPRSEGTGERASRETGERPNDN